MLFYLFSVEELKGLFGHMGHRFDPDLIPRCHTGLEMREGVLWFNPQLPRELSDVRMRIHYHGHWLTIDLTDEKLTVSFDRGRSPAASIGYRGEIHEMEQAETREFAIENR
jgi:trehalose/maltose hydrolase-like predicted phosphorylase